MFSQISFSMHCQKALFPKDNRISFELEQVVLPLKISLPFALLKNKTILDLIKNYGQRIFTPDYLIFIFKTQPTDSRTNT